MNTITFSLPLPPSLNVALRAHWAPTMKWQDEINALTYIEIRSHFKEAIPDWGKIEVKYTIFTNRMTDAENRVMVPKHVNDAIKGSGLIKDDSPEYISYELPGIVRNPSRMVEVEIRKIEEDRQGP